ncbi:MAG: type IV secretion system DNA-binding domain-containing protein [bacterium]
MNEESEINYIGTVEIDNVSKSFGLLKEDRRRHVYILGKSGMGKSTLLENMILQDIYAGNGVAFMDPLGDSAESIIDQIPGYRLQDVVYFNPIDTDFPIGLNFFEGKGEPDFLICASLMTIFKRIWEGSWSSRMEYILTNTILALLEVPGTTLLCVMKMLTEKPYRDYIISKCENMLVKSFWLNEFPRFSQQYQTEAIAPITNKIGQFFSTSLVRNILGQQRSTINVREIMDSKKILIINLSKGKIGEENANLLGAMFVSKFQLAAMGRIDMPESERNDFYLYVDEFQNFTTESFTTILSEARKYRLCLTLAHQYISQLDRPDDEHIKKAIFGNIGSTICFRLGAEDSEIMEKEIFPTKEDMKGLFLNLDKYQIITKLTVSNRPLDPFAGITLPPIYEKLKGNKQAMIDWSRKYWTRNRQEIEMEIEAYYLKGEISDPSSGELVIAKKKRKRKRKNKIEAI